MIRQGMNVTPKELIDLAIELLEDGVESKQKCQIVIINKTPKCSDTWRIEQ